MIVLDANYILRYLLLDHETMHQKAKETIESNACLVLNEVIAEVIYVLQGVYSVSREDTAKTLEIILLQDQMHMHEKKSTIIEALKLFSNTKLDYVDCCLCALKDKYEIATFDKKLLKCIG